MNIYFYRFCQFILLLIFKIWNRASLIGADQLPEREQGFIIASNHVSYLDPPLLGGCIRRPLVFLAKEKLFSLPILGKVITWLGACPIAADNDFKSLRSIIRSVKKGNAVVIFPEGTRSSSGELLEPREGVAFLSHVTKAPIVPCYIDGTDRAWPRGGRFFKPAKLKVFFGKPLSVEDGVEDHSGENPDNKQELYKRVAVKVMQEIQVLKAKANQSNSND